MRGKSWLSCVARLSCKAAIVFGAKCVRMVNLMGVFGQRLLRDFEEVRGQIITEATPELNYLTWRLV
jgi:hypothetical protein